MRQPLPPCPAVTVGIDGSRDALAAAVWAVDEAVDRELPIRLLYAIRDHNPAHPVEEQSESFARAQAALHDAAEVIRAQHRPVTPRAQPHPPKN